MISKAALKSELWQRICRCEARGDYKGVETYTAAWHKVNEESEAYLQIAGIARRAAANRAATPLDQRISDEQFSRELADDLADISQIFRGAGQ